MYSTTSWVIIDDAVEDLRVKLRETFPVTVFDVWGKKQWATEWKPADHEHTVNCGEECRRLLKVTWQDGPSHDEVAGVCRQFEAAGMARALEYDFVPHRYQLFSQSKGEEALKITCVELG